MANITQTQAFIRTAALLKLNVPAFTASVKTTTTLRDTPNKGFGLNDAGVAGLAGPLQHEFSAENLQLSSGELAFAKPDTIWELAGVVSERVRNVAKAEISGRVIACIKAVMGSGTAVSPATKLGTGGLGLSQAGKGQFARELDHVFITLIRLGLTAGDTQAGTTVSDWIALCGARFAAQSR